MKAHKYIGLQIVISAIFTAFMCTNAYGFSEIGSRNEGTAKLVGSVISTPCSIVMNNRYQTVDFSPLNIEKISEKTFREQNINEFEIELRDCGSIYTNIDSKTWVIRFDGQHAENIDGFVLQGYSEGLGVSILDRTKKRIIPSQSYPLFENVLRQDKLGRTLFLRFFLQLELTGKPIQAGSYNGLVRFFIDYQ